MKTRRLIYILIAVPFLLHVCVYVLSIPFAKPLIENKLRYYFDSGFKIDGARAYLLAGSVHVTNPRLTIKWDGWQSDIFRARKIKVSLDLFALLRGRVNVSNIVVVSPVMNFARSPGGAFNFADLIDAVKQQPPAQAADAQLQAGAEQPHPAFMHGFKKIYVKGGELNFTDRTISPRLDLKFSDIKFFLYSGYDPKTGALASVNFKLVCGTTGTASAIKIDGEIDPINVDEAPTFRLNADIADFNLTNVWPYIGDLFPLTIGGGKISLQSRVKCNGGVFENLKQAVQIRDLKITSWKDDFANSQTSGIANGLVIKFVEKNSAYLAFDFYISGNIKNVRISPGEMAFKEVGETLPTAETAKQGN